MADDKTIDIHVKDDSTSPGINPKAQRDLEKSKEAVEAISEGLYTFTYATQELDDSLGEPIDEKKKKKKKGGGGDDGDDDDSEAPTFLKFLKGASKAVQALTGVNSKATKTMAVLTRGAKLFYEQQEKSRKEQEKANALQDEGNDLTQKHQGFFESLSRTAKISSTKLAALSGSIGKLGTAVAIFTVVTAAAALAGKVFTKVITALEDNVKNFSAALNLAKAQTQAQLIQEQVASARQVGGELAGLEQQSGDVKVQLQRLETNLIDLFSPVIAALMGFIQEVLYWINAVLSILNGLLNGINTIIDIGLEILEHVPFIGRIAGYIREKITKDEIDSIEGTNKINKQIEDIFSPDDIGLRGRRNPNAPIDGQFL